MPSPFVIERGTVTIDELAAKLGVDRGTAYRLARADKLPIPVIRVGRRQVVARAALERILAGERLSSHSDGGAIMLPNPPRADCALCKAYEFLRRIAERASRPAGPAFPSLAEDNKELSGSTRTAQEGRH